VGLSVTPTTQGETVHRKLWDIKGIHFYEYDDPND
jgi:hypothetical protein